MVVYRPDICYAIYDFNITWKVFDIWFVVTVTITTICIHPALWSSAFRLKSWGRDDQLSESSYFSSFSPSKREIALYGAETWTLRAMDQKHLESFEMWCWRRMEKISWTDHVRNEEVLLRVKEQRNILHEIRKRKANWIGHILRRNCLLQRVTEGKIQGGIEVTGRRGRRRR